MGTPLFFDEVVERKERARLVHVLNRWLHMIFPNCVIIARRPGRKSIEMQLRKRARFAAEAWAKYGRESQIVAVFKTIQRELALPNHHFIPEDPLTLLISSAYGIDGVFALQAIETQHGAKYGEQDLERIGKEEWTVGQFVADVIRRSSAVVSPE